MAHKLTKDLVSCLSGNSWLNDEVIHAFISIVADGIRFTPLDPCLIQTQDMYRIRGYPITNGELLFPLNMYGNHWSLAWLRPARKSIVLYDSLGHLYSYSPQLLPLQEREKLEKSWRKVTDISLEVISIKSTGAVHVQEDRYNCGVFVCLYAERLCKDERTVQEVATANFLKDYRQYIRNRITASDTLCRTGELDHNGNLICYIPRKEKSQARDNTCAMSVPNVPWEPTLCQDDNVKRESTNEFKHADARVSGLEPSTKLARIEDLENDHCYTKPCKHISMENTRLSPCSLAEFLRAKYAGSNTDFIVLGCDACRMRESCASSIFILYLNRTKQLGVALITRTSPSRSRAVVLDFTATCMPNNFRQELKDSAIACGFLNPSFAIIPTTRKFSWTQFEVQVVGICAFVENYMLNHLVTEVQLPTEYKIRSTLDEIRLLMKTPVLSVSSGRKRKTRNIMAKSSNAEFFTLGEMNKMCSACGAFLFQKESSSICCNGGEVVVPESVFNPRRDPLLDWFWDAALRDENLFYMIRPINNMLACAGLCINLKSFKGSSGQRPLVLQGRFDIGLCHLNPNSDRACFAQLFIADDFKVQRSIEETMKSWNTKVEFTVLRRIMDILRKNNPIVQSYMTMYEIYSEELQKQHTQETDAPKVMMNIKQKRDVAPSLTSSIHPGRLNVPVFENQIAAIYVSKEGGMLTHEELNEGLRIMSRGGNTIAPHHSYNIDPLTYPLYFVRGEQTFVKEKLPKHRVNHCSMRKSNRNDSGLLLEEHYEEDADDDNEDNRLESREERKTRYISRREFALYILARRGDIHKHRIIGTGKLYSQYVLHTFARIEADRLSSIGLHRTELRSSTASTLFKYLDDKLKEKGVKLGKLVNMPQKYVGSRNWYQKLYSDAMAVAQRLGKPDLFITFTGSQDWPEIKNNLPGKFDSWITDPVLCCRVFFLRLTELLHDIKKKEIFGKVVALHGSIEFQKRGMPHAHLLITLENKIDTPEKIDSIICAEIPEYPNADDPQREEKLRFYTLMKKHMIHGPCSERPELACREADSSKCARGYPKRYREYTELCSGGYPLYRRRNDGRVVSVGKMGKTFASNRDVVPTNPYLLMKHECHVNVEVCAAIQAFKYIFKYIFKGPDAVVLELVQDDDLLRKNMYTNEKNEKLVNIDMREVYRLARYVSHIEAAYRILRYPMQYSSHTISLMPHLPNEQPIYFSKTPDVAKSYKSRLLAYFELAVQDENVKNMTWVDVAENYRFTKGKYVPYKRQGRRIARLWSVNPKMLELYAVRKLLLHRKGVQSFEDLRTHNGKLYDSFMEAAEAAGYIEKTSEWEDCLRCVCTEEMPSTIRRIFAHILLYCKPSNPLELWHKFKADMRSKQCTETVTMEDLKSLRHIEHILTANGMKMSNCGLEGIFNDLGDDVEVQSDTFDESDSDKAHYDQEAEIGMLNRKQQYIVFKVLEAARLKKSSDKSMFFIYGKAGCGKTFTFNTLIRLLKHIGLSVIAVASTGIAATLLEGGRTAHSTFSLPLQDISADTVPNVDASSVQGMILRNVDVIVWDEISMQSRFAIEIVDKLLRDLAAPENRTKPFGGVVMVFGGDWCQFLPVVRGASKLDTINETLKASCLWKMMQILVLDENMRLRPGEENYAAWLRGVGEGTNFTTNGTDVEIPAEMCMESEDEVIEWMYTDQALRDPNLIGSMALLTVRNSDAIELNERVLEMISGDAIALYGIDTPVSEQEGIVGMPCDDEEFLHNMTPSGMPPYRLLLKPGAIIMLLRNINIEERLCNGTRLQVLSIIADNRMLKCKNLLTQETAHITRMPLDFADERTGVAFRRFQFPVRLSYCMTINKSQGQTFEKVGIIMRTPSFAHGSTYVALSRARSKEQVKITINSRRPIRQSLRIRNIVYSEIIGL